MKDNKVKYNPDVAASAIRRMNDSARENGSSEMTLDEINAEISAYRKERSKNE